MLGAIILVVLTIICTWKLLREFPQWLKMLSVLLIILYSGFVSYRHYNLVNTTGNAVVYDRYSDTAYYQDQAEDFKDVPFWDISISDIKNNADGMHFGYQALIVLMQRISDSPMLATRLAKIFLYFFGLCMLARTWRNQFGIPLATKGYLFFALFFTPMHFYVFRNLKDLVILSVFMMIMAVVDSLFDKPYYSYHLEHKPVKNNLKKKLCLLIFLLMFIAVLRLYMAVIIVLPVLAQIVMTRKAFPTKLKVTLFSLIILVFVVALISGYMSKVFLYGGKALSGGLLGYNLLQGFFSPIPWGAIWSQDIVGALFWVWYWPLIAYSFFCFVSELRSNMTWHILACLMLVMILSIAVGHPYRKRLAVIPIMVMWILKYQYLCKYRQHIKWTKNIH